NNQTSKVYILQNVWVYICQKVYTMILGRTWSQYTQYSHSITNLPCATCLLLTEILYRYTPEARLSRKTSNWFAAIDGILFSFLPVISNNSKSNFSLIPVTTTFVAFVNGLGKAFTEIASLPGTSKTEVTTAMLFVTILVCAGS